VAFVRTADGIFVRVLCFETRYLESLKRRRSPLAADIERGLAAA
jgi:hypothetical protein